MKDRNLPLMKYRFLFILSLLKSMKMILIVLSFSRSVQSCVLSSYKIKVSASARRRFDSGDVRRQSRVDVPRWSLRFKIGGQCTFSAPLMWAELNDRNERQSITVHFWVRELAMFTTVSGARGQIKSFSSITTMLFDSAETLFSNYQDLSLFAETNQKWIIIWWLLLLCVCFWPDFSLNWRVIQQARVYILLFPPISLMRYFCPLWRH